jgi:hypothetical protein
MVIDDVHDRFVCMGVRAISLKFRHWRNGLSIGIPVPSSRPACEANRILLKVFDHYQNIPHACVVERYLHKT